MAYLGTPDPDSDAVSDIFVVWAALVLGTWGAKLLALAVLISAVSSMMTTILPTARGTLSMAVYRDLSAPSLRRHHPKYLTPSFHPDDGCGLDRPAGHRTQPGQPKRARGDTVTWTSFAIAFYYGLTWLVGVWYRKMSFSSPAFFTSSSAGSHHPYRALIAERHRSPSTPTTGRRR